MAVVADEKFFPFIQLKFQCKSYSLSRSYSILYPCERTVRVPPSLTSQTRRPSKAWKISRVGACPSVVVTGSRT